MPGTVAIYSPHDDIRLLLRSLLRLHHYRVLGEGTSPAELRALQPGAEHAIVLDADLEEVGWSEAVHQLHRSRPDLKFVLVTASRSPRVDAQAHAVGISAVLRRPFAMRELVETMRSVDPPSPSGAPMEPLTGPTDGGREPGSPHP